MRCVFARSGRLRTRCSRLAGSIGGRCSLGRLASAASRRELVIALGKLVPNTSSPGHVTGSAIRHGKLRSTQRFGRSGFRWRCTSTCWPVRLRLPALPVALTVTFSSNSPPISSLHFTHTEVSGMALRRPSGISAPHRVQYVMDGDEDPNV